MKRLAVLAALCIASGAHAQQIATYAPPPGGDTCSIDVADDLAGFIAKQKNAVYIRAGCYKLSKTVNLTDAGAHHIFGAGEDTVIRPDAGVTAFVVVAARGFDLHDLTIAYAQPDQKGAAAFVIGGPDGSVNIGSRIHDNHIARANFGVVYNSTILSTINNNFFDAVTIGINIRNVYNVDWGDNKIYANGFTARNFSDDGYGVLWFSGGGLNVRDNKFLGFKYGVYLYAVDPKVVTSDFVIADNSFERGTNDGAAVSIIYWKPNQLTNISITGNQQANMRVPLHWPQGQNTACFRIANNLNGWPDQRGGC